VGSHAAQQVDADRLLRLQRNHGEAMGMLAAISGSSRLARVTRNGDAGRAAVKLLLITLAQGSIYARCMSCCRLTVSSTSVVSALIGRLGYRVAGGG